ncbi:MAG: VRR-NUC domain-containing protein [Planctomycetaceae bacterium]|nr:VRR-NUC domain-containing protein [Planctomycetaceae bacterium]
MTTPLEISEERRFVRHCESLGLEALKLRIDGQDGFPDRTVFHDGRTIYFEFKRAKTGKLRPQQRRWKKRLEQLGFEVIVPTSFEQAREELERWMAAE